MTSSTPPPPAINPIYEAPQSNAGPGLHVYMHTGAPGSGGNSDAPSWGNFDERLRKVENAVTRIDERLTHIPTKSQLWWYVFVGGIAPFAAAVWWIVQEIIKL